MINCIIIEIIISDASVGGSAILKDAAGGKFELIEISANYPASRNLENVTNG